MADYFGLPMIVSLILAIIPFTAWICGFVTRFKEGAIIAGIIRLFFGCWIIWIIDLVLCLLNGCTPNILRIINC